MKALISSFNRRKAEAEKACFQAVSKAKTLRSNLYLPPLILRLKALILLHAALVYKNFALPCVAYKFDSIKCTAEVSQYFL